MNNQPDERHSSYYSYFDELTNGGRVFDLDLSDALPSLTSLTQEEAIARNNYANVLQLLSLEYDHIGRYVHPVATTKEEVLQQRIVAPSLMRTNVSARSPTIESKAFRIYPRNLHPWTVFRDNVEEYIFDGNSTLTRPLAEIFNRSLFYASTAWCVDESQEQNSIMFNLRNLENAGIIHGLGRPPSRAGRVGRIDFCVMRDENVVSIIVECKSTQNLLLPMSAQDCVTSYNEAYEHGIATGERSRKWSNVAHPIGQLLGYMVDNNHRYGALTSATRTYFISIQDIVADDASFKETSNNDVRKIDSNTAGTYNSVNSNNLLKRSAGSKTGGQVERPKKGMRAQRAFAKSSGTYGASGLKADERGKQLILDPNSIFSTPKQGKKKSQNDEDDQRDIYFEQCNGIKVCISDAWFVGEVNYLRAWAYMHHLRETMGPLTIPNDWIHSTTTMSTPDSWRQRPLFGGSSDAHDVPEGDGTDDRKPSVRDDVNSTNKSSTAFADSCNMEYFYPSHQGALLYVPFKEIGIMSVIGDGRNGACFKVEWNDTEYAMKQFDIGRDGDTNFKKEIRAYMLLREVWGILVPRPFFLSESFSGGIMFLGLQLGREATSEEILLSFEQVKKEIEERFGIRHNDAERGRNCIVISDTIGAERLVAIDFEDWDDTKVGRCHIVHPNVETISDNILCK